jgi:hypothetical protein
MLIKLLLSPLQGLSKTEKPDDFLINARTAIIEFNKKKETEVTFKDLYEVVRLNSEYCYATFYGTKKQKDEPVTPVLYVLLLKNQENTDNYTFNGGVITIQKIETYQKATKKEIADVFQKGGYFKGTVAESPATSRPTSFSYSPQQGDLLDKVVASMGRSPDKTFSLKMTTADKKEIELKDTLMLVYFAQNSPDFEALVIGSAQQKVVSWKTYAKKDEFETFIAENAYAAPK